LQTKKNNREEQYQKRVAYQSSGYGEAFEIEPGQTFVRPRDERPFAGIVWSGSGKLNGNDIDVMNNAKKEFLVTPKTDITIINTGKTPLLMYTVFPIQSDKNG